MPEDLPPSVLNATVLNDGRANQALAEVGQQHSQAALEATSNNRTKSAKMLGISPATLWRKLKRYEG